MIANLMTSGALPQYSNRLPQYFTLHDGRQIAYDSVGDPNGQPVLFFHGSPGSRLDVCLAEAAALKHGWYIVAPDRPGMGHSDFKPEYTLLDYTNDICQLADGLGFSTFGVMGHSGGGTTVLSCAYALPKRLEFALDLAGWAPVTVPDLRFQMTALDRFFAERIARSQKTIPILFQVPFATLGLAAKVLPAKTFVRLLYRSQYFCDADYAVLSVPENAQALIHTVRESFHQGSKGPAHDALLRYQDWGFDLAEIDFPIHIFHGRDDVSAPYAFAEYKHRYLANSQLHAYSHEGHFFLWSHWDDIMETV
ncbi:alpha/beta hydrolase [Oscillatoria sp. CS-180]|uniref:alpha/beta fold hydrolase n=1 Tax=Oscillatoria sp. CS-180 TaxID=3021720 RepID=UPI00232F1237|nr:alpha/beta hydrolase [Oscillatoria sp. CS-180]MDB9527568.1 alpha/beta hydrolase [Oscillatoria sp. CS-180]